MASINGRKAELAEPLIEKEKKFAITVDELQ